MCPISVRIMGTPRDIAIDRDILSGGQVASDAF